MVYNNCQKPVLLPDYAQQFEVEEFHVVYQTISAIFFLLMSHLWAHNCPLKT